MANREAAGSQGRPAAVVQSVRANWKSCCAGRTDGFQYVEHLEADGDEVFEAACKLGLEGIVSKRLAAPYTVQVSPPRTMNLASALGYSSLTAECAENAGERAD